MEWKGVNFEKKKEGKKERVKWKDANLTYRKEEEEGRKR